MVLNKKMIALITSAVSFMALFFCATNVDAARMDMVDVSNYNGDMTVIILRICATTTGLRQLLF